MGKFQIRTVSQFLIKKRLYDTKKDPVWVYLENEMKANIDRKPYNEKVGNWLKFLKDLKLFYHCEAKSKLRRLERNVGPRWYVEFSSYQREVLGYLKSNIHVDLLENYPSRVAQSLRDLGITLKLKKKVLMNAMRNCQDEVGLFMWALYEMTYHVPPCVLQKKYTRDAMIMMSSLVFIDLKDCIEALDKMTAVEKEPPPPVKKSKPAIKKNPCPYLQKSFPIRLYSNHPSGPREPAKPLPLGYKVKLRTKASYTKLCEDISFIERRRQKYLIKETNDKRVCNYKFWDPPIRSLGASQGLLAKKMKMIKLKAKQKFKSPYKNVQFHLGGVAFTGQTPNYILPNVTLVPTGYTIINGGVAPIGNQFVTIIQGHWVFPRKIIEACDATCSCVEKWGEAVMGYLRKSSCKCGHPYDVNNKDGDVCNEKLKFFYPPNRHGPYWVDLPKIFRMNTMDDFIKDCVSDALRTKGNTPNASMPTLSAGEMSNKTLLGALLADLSDSTLFIPHLPEANYLNNLLEWTRKRINGKLTPKEHRKFLLLSERKWLDLKHIDFRARAYYIPFSMKQLDSMTWKHRQLVQELFDILMDDFVTRNRIKQLEQSRLYWPTTYHDAHPCKAFLDLFFTYLPGRMQDTFLISPYCTEFAANRAGKICPLNKSISMF